VLFQRPGLGGRKSLHGVSLQRVIGDVVHDFRVRLANLVGCAILNSQADDWVLLSF
jgi:hypothetical protein